jgi:hypothetical protein
MLIEEQNWLPSSRGFASEMGYAAPCARPTIAVIVRPISWISIISLV